MEGLIELLYSIPVLGLFFQFVGYLIEVFPNIAPIVLSSATPIALAALCGVMCERAGVVNIGIEGIMIATAFVGWYAGVLLVPALGEPQFDLFGITPALVLALLIAIVAGMLISLLHAWLSITARADQIISGTIINIAAFGITGYLNTLISQTSPEWRRRISIHSSLRQSSSGFPSSDGSSTCSSGKGRSRCRCSSS